MSAVPASSRQADYDKPLDTLTVVSTAFRVGVERKDLAVDQESTSAHYYVYDSAKY
jgi:hypothetical protein